MTKIYCYTSILFSALGLAFTAATVGSGDWVNIAFSTSGISGSGSSGPFQVCGIGLCISLNVAGQVTAFAVGAAFMILAMISMLVATVLLIYRHFTDKGDHAKIAAVFNGIACLFALIAMSSFTGLAGRLYGGAAYGWGFGLGWASFPVAAIASILSYLASRNES